MTQHPRIAAVVVTFERPDILDEALQAVDDPTWPVDEIVVVDNGSGGRAADSVVARYGHH